MHSEIILVNGERPSGVFLLLQRSSLAAWDSAVARPALPIHPISAARQHFFLSRFAPSVPAKGLFPSKRNTPEKPQTGSCKRVGCRKSKRPRDWQKYRTRMSHSPLVTAKTAKDGERKHRAATQDTIQASNRALGLGALGRNSGQWDWWASEIRQS